MSTATLSSVPALERGLDVLEALNETARGLGISELAARLNLNKNAVFRITHTLTARGYLERDPESKRFRLSSKLLTIGHPRAADVSLVEVALPAMRALRDETRETVQVGFRVGDAGMIIEQVSGLHALRIAVDVGLQFPLHSNAPGKVLLAFQSPEEVAATIERLPLRRYTSRTIVDPVELQRECDSVRKLGYAADYAEADEGIHCVAAPIFDPEARLTAAVWISAPSRRMPKGLFSRMGKQVIQCAAVIGEGLQR